MNIETSIKENILSLQGPIVIFGAGGFIGSNLFRNILKYRQDVIAVTSKDFITWRLDDLNLEKIVCCDITEKKQLQDLFEKYHFKTIFDYAAYGAYSSQNNTEQIYKTNLLGLINIIEVAEQFSIHSFVHAGSSSEYGLNCAAPAESDTLTPNSHYAVSKVSGAYLVKFYGTINDFPITNLRFYSIYGPYEDPDRLIPQLITKGNEGKFPPLVQPDISRDFVYIDDAVLASLKASINIKNIKGESLNIASGKKTTIREIANEIKEIFNIENQPEWGDFPNRKWDLKEWYGDASQAKKLIDWECFTSLQDGLIKTKEWQLKYALPLLNKKIHQDRIKHKLSAVIACYKDAQAIPIMYERLTKVFKKIEVDYEFIFVNDCSPDNTNEVLQNIVNSDNKVIAIEHSRNFGSQSAFLSGMELSTGDGVVLLDGDLQDPPELIEEFYKEFLNGNDVVYGRRVARDGNKTLVRFYKIFYRLFRSISYVPIPLDAGDFSLMHRKVVDELVKMPETDQFLRGLRAWVGFKQTGVDYVRPERMFGVTTNNMRKNISWARKAIFSFSFVPLELLSYFGWALTIFSFIAIIIQIVLYFILPGNPHGITAIIVLILFFGGIQMLGISILGEYQAKIFEETKKRPKFIRKSIFKKD